MLSARDHRHPLPLAIVCVMAALTACSVEGQGSKALSPGPAPSAAQSAAQSGAPSENGPAGVSAGGVTTRLDIPAESTEEQYAQACLAAKDWMDSRGGDPHTLVESYLEDLTGSTETGRATFQKTWAELSDPQRAGVIIAVRAAADGGC